MAREIKATPIIQGKDAAAFFNKLEENKNKKVDREVLWEIEQSAKYFESLRLKNGYQL